MVVLIEFRRMVRSLLRLIPTTRQATFYYGCVCLGLGWCVEEPAFLAMGLLLCILGLGWDYHLWVIERLRQRYEASFDRGLRLSVGAAVLVLYQRWTSEPAYAFFLGKACGVLKKITSSTGLGGGDATTTGSGGNVTRLIEATIFIIRGLFLVYLAISAINVFKLMQRDEDWQTAIRAPLIAVIMIAVVEGISAIVAPDVAENC